MIKESNLNTQLHIKHTLQSLHDDPRFKSTRGPQERADMDKMLRAFIFRYLYYLISNNGEYLPVLFTATLKEKFPSSLDDAINVDDTSISKHDTFYSIDDTVARVKHKHTGRNCGRKFQPGEPIYRCQECGFDDTCVLCIHCFNSKDHENHHVYTNICTEFNNGICDCGDEEAWNTSLHCKAGEEEEEVDSDYIFQSDEVSRLFELVLSEVFDHFIDVFNQNIEPLPTIQKDLTLILREMVQQGKLFDRAQLLKDIAYKNSYIEAQQELSRSPSPVNESTAMVDPKDYAVMVYNDEYHNYTQATAALRQGLPDNKHIDRLTARIDSEGRAMLKCSHDLSSVIGGFFAVQTNGLSATLTPWSEYIHQEACKYIILWVNHCLTIPNPAFQNKFRDAMSKVLCSEYIRAREAVDMTPVVDKYFTNKFTETYAYKYADLSVLQKGNTIPLGHHKVLPPSGTNKISLHLNKAESPTSRKYSNSRLQQILFFDNRYWKGLRKEVQDMIIPTLSSSLKFKPLFCNQLVEIFNHMTRSVAFMDREPQLTALRESVVQLFTCPTNARNIFENGSFNDIMWSIVDIFAESSSVEDGMLVWRHVQKSNPTKSYSISFKQGLYAVETILSKIVNPNYLLRPAEFISIVTLCKLFNGAWKIKRKEGEHVVREDQSFISYLEYTTSIYSIVQTIEKVFENSKGAIDESLLLNAIKLLNTFLGHRTLPYKLVFDSHEIIKCKVSKQRVAFMNPVHTLFSFLVEKVPLKKAFEAISDCNDFLVISDFSLRSVVLCSQIDVGLWVRNGMSVLHQSSYYKNNPEMSSYSRDIHLNQLAFLKENDDIPRLIYNLLDRWELLEWFAGEVEFGHTVYDEKIVHILQQFIAFTYQLLSERQFFKKFESAEEKGAYYIRNAIIYNLYTQPLSYTKLLRSIPDYLTERTSQFDEVLAEVSTYVEPKGLEDSGVFKLKREMYKRIDPLRLLNMENDFEHSATIIKSRLAETKEDAPKVVLQPQIESPKYLDETAKELGTFTRNSTFAKLIYKLLQTSIDLEESTFIYELLHLIHGIFKDDKLVNGKSSVPEAYISKPICNLLLTIVDSKSSVFSENVIRKADYLLENMILNRPVEILDSLVTCFGQEYVDTYKMKKLNQGVDFEESEKERKKRLAKERQQRIMSKFSKQQNKFIKENEAEFTKGDKDIDMTGENALSSCDEFSCALCQDSTSTDALVIPIYHENSPIFRNGDIHNPQEFSKDFNGFFNDDEHPTVHDDKTLESYRDDGTKGSRKVFVSCNHHIHYECFKRYVQKKRFSSHLFICPLCQTFSNCVLPVYRLSNMDSITTLESLLYEPSSEETIGMFFKENSHIDFNSIWNMFKEINKSNTNYDKNFSSITDFEQPDVSYILAVHWANTISMVEISSRIDESPYDSLMVGKEQKFRTLRNVLTSMAWLYSVMGKPNPEHIPYINKNGIIWNQNQLFQYIVRSVLFTKDPISEIITRALSAFSSQLIVEFIKGLTPATIEKMYLEAEKSGRIYNTDSKMLKVLGSICEVGISEAGLYKKLYDLAYTCLLRNVSPTLRRCLILLKSINEILKGSEADLIIDGVNLETELKYTEGHLPEYVDQIICAITKNTSLEDILLNAAATTSLSTDPYLKNIPYEFCGVVKLVDLAKFLNTYVTNTKQIKLRHEHPAHMKNVDNRLDFKICLTCGVKVHIRNDQSELSKHLIKHCFKPFGLFLIPNENEVCLTLSSPLSVISISAPYLNSHGEAGHNAIQRGDLTTLNLQRYKRLNKLWLNNEIPGYISRIMGDEFRVSIISSGVVFNFNRNVLRRPRRVVDGNESSSSELEDEDEEMGDADDMEWGELRPEDMFTDGVFRLGGGAPGNGGDIRDFFQFITNIRNDADAALGAAVDNGFPQFQFIPTFRPDEQREEEEEEEEDNDGDDDDEATTGRRDNLTNR